jgi:phosphoribosylamine--glycine ligase/phosphoribosylformylglycinamidine cyclo-ligase
MEGSKAFSKDFMARRNIPTAAYKTFKSEQIADAIQYVTTCGHKVVLKASGLAGGKGVLIPDTIEETVAGLNEIMVANAFGEAGRRSPPNLQHICIERFHSQAMKSSWKNC